MAEAVGRNVIRRGDVGMPTINGYAYYYYRTLGMWRMMGKSLTAVRALVRGKAHMGVAGWRDFSHPRYEQGDQDWSAKPVGGALRSGAAGRVRRRCWTPARCTTRRCSRSFRSPRPAKSSFRAFYDRLVRRDWDPPAQTFLLGYDSEPIRAEKSLYDLAMWARAFPGWPTALSRSRRRHWLPVAAHRPPPAGFDQALWQQWQARSRATWTGSGMRSTTWTSPSPVPADDPSSLLETVKFYLRGQGNDPHERQRLSAERREAQTERRAPGSGRNAGRRLPSGCSGGPRATAPIREDALADVGLAWPLLRRMLLELGRRLVDSGVIAAAGRCVLAARTGAAERRRVRPGRAGRPAAVAITGADRPSARTPSRSAKCSGGARDRPLPRSCSRRAGGWSRPSGA